jgi:CelD/BcsL family acetyltransferase involved in cellulose biosynthesis
MSSVEEINNLPDLARCRLLWNSLCPGTPNATFLHTLDWLEVYWRHYGSGQKLRALIVSAAGKAIGILPLVVQTESTRLGPVRILTYPLHGWGTVYGPIGPNPTATLLAGLRHVRRTRRDWDLLDLRWVDKTGSDRGRTRRAMELAGFRPREQAWARAAMVEMSGSWEAYWKGRTKKWRHNVRRLHRRLAEQGKLRHIRYRPEGEARGDGDPRWDLYDACVQLSQKSWQNSSQSGTTLCHPSVARYLRETHAVAAKRGALDLNLLLLDGTPAAFVYNYHCRGSVYALRVGFDPRLRAFGPGTVLQQMVFKGSFRRGDHLYDLGVGSLDYKRNWQTSTVTSYRYTHFPATDPRAQLLRVKRWFQDRFSNVDDLVLARSA